MRVAFEHVGITPELSWRYAVRRSPSFRFKWHFHPEFELTLITEGSGTRFVGDSIEAYEAGDLVLVGPNVPHTYESTTSTNEAYIFQFRRDFLGEALFDSPELQDVARLLTSAARGLAFSDSDTDLPEKITAAVAGMEVLSSARRTIALLDVLTRLSEAPRARPLATEGYRPRLPGEPEHRVDAVFDFLHAEHDKPITVADVARIAHLSPSAFSRFFRRTTGRTLTSYVTELRVAAACRALVDTDSPIARIAVESGFANLSNFNRRFRVLKQMSPREFRAHHSPRVVRPVSAIPTGQRLVRPDTS